MNVCVIIKGFNGPSYDLLLIQLPIETVQLTDETTVLQLVAFNQLASLSLTGCNMKPENCFRTSIFSTLY